MSMLRIPSTQPPSDATTIVSAGRVPCWTTSHANSHDHSGLAPLLYACDAGNQPSVLENTAIAMRPIQKYGTVDMKVATGTIASAALPRRHPTTAPIELPRKKLRTVAMPTSPSVHGSATAITSPTGARPLENERP